MTIFGRDINSRSERRSNKRLSHRTTRLIAFVSDFGLHGMLIVNPLHHFVVHNEIDPLRILHPTEYHKLGGGNLRHRQTQDDPLDVVFESC